MAASRVLLTIKSAKGLRNTDPNAFGKSDPYCTCEIQGKPTSKLQTKVVKDNLNPIWQQTFEFRDFKQADVLLFQVYDKDDWPKKDDFLGKTLLKASDVLPNGFKGDLPLENEDGATISIEVVVPGSAGSTSPSTVPEGVAAARPTMKGESLEWLNDMVERMWPYINGTVQRIMNETVTPMLQDIMPMGLKGTCVSKCTLGDTTPKFGPIQVIDTEKGVKLQLSICYQSNCDICISAVVANLGISGLSLRGDLVVRLEPLLNQSPVVGGIVIYFLDTPELDLDFTGVANIADLPGLAGKVRGIISSALSNAITLPNIIAVPIGGPKEGVDLAMLKQLTPLGVLRVNVLSASKLQHEHGDPRAYVSICLGGHTWRTKPAGEGTNPLWSEEHHDFVVYDAESRIRVEVLNESTLSSNDLIGRAVPLAVQEALHTSDAQLAIYGQGSASNSSKEQGQECGTVSLRFQWLELCPGQKGVDNCMIVVKIQKAFMPTQLGSKAAVRGRILGGDGGIAVEKATALGTEPAPEACKAAVQKSLAQVARRCYDMGMVRCEIADVTGLELEQVDDALAGLPPRNEEARHRVWAPHAQTQKASGWGIFCKRRARTAETTHIDPPDLENAPLADLKLPPLPGAQQVLVQVDIVATLFLAIGKKVADLGKEDALEISLVNEKRNEVAKFTIPLSRIVGAPNLQLPGPLLLVPTDGGQGIELEAELSLWGSQPLAIGTSIH